MEKRSKTSLGAVPPGLVERGMSFDAIPAPKVPAEESPFARKIRENAERLSPTPKS